MQLGSGIAVTVVDAGSCSSDWTPRLGTSIYCKCSPKKKGKQTTEGRPGLKEDRKWRTGQRKRGEVGGKPERAATEAGPQDGWRKNGWVPVSKLPRRG